MYDFCLLLNLISVSSGGVELRVMWTVEVPNVGKRCGPEKRVSAGYIVIAAPLKRRGKRKVCLDFLPTSQAAAMASTTSLPTDGEEPNIFVFCK